MVCDCATLHAQSLVHGNKVDAALNYLRGHLDVHASNMDEETQLRLYTTVMQGFQLRGEHHRARHVFKDMRRRDLTADKFAMKFFNVSRNILYPDQVPRREDNGNNEDEGEWNDSNV
jgi:pentatricopeptide repeat protein